MVKEDNMAYLNKVILIGNVGEEPETGISERSCPLNFEKWAKSEYVEEK